MNLFLEVVFLWFPMLAAGWAIAAQKGRSRAEGFWLAALLGPWGLLIEARLASGFPDQVAARQAEAAKGRQEEAERRTVRAERWAWDCAQFWGWVDPLLRGVPTWGWSILIAGAIGGSMGVALWAGLS